MSEFCKECDGWGKVGIEIFVPQNFDRDVGYIDHMMVECPKCEGTGEKEVENDLSE